jgi:23S rRNA U2552 (ribose-2'-O)-methylase RlmE/FtsJ
MYTYVQDVTDQNKVNAIFAENGVKQVDFIQSDMAPNTIGDKETDAIRSIGLLEQTLRIYDKYLKSD